MGHASKQVDLQSLKEEREGVRVKGMRNVRVEAGGEEEREEEA